MRLTKNTVTVRLLLFLGVFLALNLAASAFFFRLDFTADKRYTLSRTTKDILKDLKDPVTVTAYFTDDLPPRMGFLKNDFKDLLAEYRNYSDRNVDYEFISPNESDEKEVAAQRAGIQPIMINVRERDQTKQQRAYLGAVVKLGSQQEVIPFLQPGAAMEYALSKAIKKISVENKPKVGLVQGHGEVSMENLAQAAVELSALYDLDTLSLDNDSRWPEFKTLVLLAPLDQFSQDQLDRLDKFLASGGGLFVGINTVNGDLGQSTQPWDKVTTGLESWLRGKGVDVAPVFITDARCSNVTVRQQQGFFVFNSQVPFHYFPTITRFADHPITKGMEAVNLQFASPVSLVGTDTAIRAVPIAFTSEKSGKVNPPVTFNLQKQWSDADFPYQQIPVAAALEGKLGGDAKARMVVVSDGDFCAAPAGQGQLPQDNINLLVNSADWLTDDTGLIGLRTKGVQSRPIKRQLGDGAKTVVKYANFLIPIVLVILFGLVRAQLRRRKRKQWMDTPYS
jgi:gliding-associated putative ABC transporter substrate-binding component GldG